MTGRRYNCRCGKKRYRDEGSALVAAAGDAEAYGGTVTAYRCPGGLAWHLTAHGFVPEALRSVGRRLAHELAERGEVDPAAFRARHRIEPGSRRWRRVDECAARLVAYGLARPTAGGHLAAVDRAGLERVVRVGLDGYEA